MALQSPVAKAKTEMVGGIIHCRPMDIKFIETDIYGVVTERSPIFEGGHDTRSAYFRMKNGDVIKSHKHRKWVQVVVIGGSLKVQQGEASAFVAFPGDVYFLDPGFVHVETAMADSLLAVTQGDDRPEWE